MSVCLADGGPQVCALCTLGVEKNIFHPDVHLGHARDRQSGQLL